MLDDILKTQLQSYLTRLTQPIEVIATLGDGPDVNDRHKPATSVSA